MAELNGSKTQENLKIAFADESQVNRRGLYFSPYEYIDMYPGMAKVAREEGFDDIADWFETLARAERSHAKDV